MISPVTPDQLTPAERECFDAVVADIKLHGVQRVATEATARLLGEPIPGEDSAERPAWSRTHVANLASA